MLVADFNEFAVKYAPLVEKTIQDLIGPSQDIEDITQDVFLYFWDKINDFDDSGPVALLMTCAKHRAVDYLRHQKRIKQVSIGDYGGLPNPATEDHTEDIEQIKDGLRQMPRSDQKLIYLRFGQGYTLEKCARLIGSTRMGVDRKVKQILRRLHCGHKMSAPKFANL